MRAKQPIGGLMLQNQSCSISFILRVAHTLFYFSLAAVVFGCGGADCPDGRMETFDNACVCPDGTDETNDGACVATSDSPAMAGDASLDDLSSNDSTSAPIDDVSARFPWNGFTTGSARAGNTDAASSPLRPTFIWNTVEGASHYQLQIDDDCSPEGFRACDFPSPERDTRINAGRATVAENGFAFRLREDLPVSFVAPVGRRYYWRVRACLRRRCSSWTEIRYLDVGRLHSDYDCDGYSDLAVGARDAAFVYFGGSEGLGLVPLRSYEDPGDGANAQFGFPVASAGDVNGDGCSDLLIGARGSGGRLGRGKAYLYLGSPSGLPRSHDLEIDNPTSSIGFFGNVAAAGDLDGDGYGEVIIGADQQNNGANDEGAAYIYWGSHTGLDLSDPVFLNNPRRQERGEFGSSVAGIGDTNGDGYADFLVGARGQHANAHQSGSAYVYFGQSRGAIGMPEFETETTAGTGAEFGWAATGGGDLNGDGYADFAVGARLFSNSSTETGAVEVYFGTSSIEEQRRATLIFRNSTTVDEFGASLSGRGDVNGDGIDDLAIGAPGRPAPDALGSGQAYVFLGTTDLFPQAPSRGYPSLGNVASDRGHSVSVAGDVNGDGFDDLAVSSPVSSRGGHIDIYFGPIVTRTRSNQRLFNPGVDDADRFGKSIY